MSATRIDPNLSDGTLQSTTSTSATTPQISHDAKTEEVVNNMSHWRQHHPDFAHVLGDTPSLDLLLELPYAFAHEAGVYFPANDEVFITSNRLIDATTGEQSVEITKISLKPFRRQHRQVTQQTIPCGQIHMGNGGVNYGSDTILFCSQGSRTSLSGLYVMDRAPPFETKPLLTSYHGTPFNSVNDVVVSKVDGTVWFTDPPYASEQGYKDDAMLPPQVYCFHPRSGQMRAVADGFGHPNGLCFSPDEGTMYVTDTDKVHGGGDTRHDRPSSIYAFDVVMRHGTRFLANRRLFAFVEAGIPDGIKCDTAGRVYSGCGDGIHIWNSGGLLLGRIVLEGGVANFCFGRAGEIFALNETRMWRVGMAETTQGALLADLQKGREAGGEKHRAGSGHFWQRLLDVFRQR